MNIGIGKYEKFITQNVAPYNAVKIGVYKDNAKQGSFYLQNLRMPVLGRKLYSFGALSDVHITYSTATEDFQKALTYLNNDVDVAFTCICGDLTVNGTEDEFLAYKTVVDGYSADTPVYAITGNHEQVKNTSSSYFQNYTGRPLYYSFEHGDDVFIMVGEYSWSNYYLFEDGQLQWLYETLEANRNKRCFVFFHVFPPNDSGNADNIYGSDLFSGTQGTAFQNLMKHYKNVIFFHGHSHLRFDLQEIDPKANYNESLGYRSVHIPSLSVPRDVNADGTGRVDVYAESEGYVVDVYKNHVVLRGRDFVADKFLPIAQYCIDTALVEVEANTFKDSTGLIVT